jgi:hypothetical protein
MVRYDGGMTWLGYEVRAFTHATGRTWRFFRRNFLWGIIVVLALPFALWILTGQWSWAEGQVGDTGVNEAWIRMLVGIMVFGGITLLAGLANLVLAPSRMERKDKHRISELEDALERSHAAANQRLDVEVLGRIHGHGRISDTSDGRNPAWTLFDPTYAGGWSWEADLTFVNRGHQPVNLDVALAMPVRKDDPSRRWRREPLRKPLGRFRPDVAEALSQRPEHLSFPIHIEAGHSVKGHLEVAISRTHFEVVVESGSFNAIMMAPKCYLEVKDLLSGKTLEVQI